MPQSKSGAAEGEGVRQPALLENGVEAGPARRGPGAKAAAAALENSQSALSLASPAKR